MATRDIGHAVAFPNFFSLFAQGSGLPLWPELAEINFPTALTEVATLDRYRLPIFVSDVEPFAATFRANSVMNIKNHQDASFASSNSKLSQNGQQGLSTITRIGISGEKLGGPRFSTDILGQHRKGSFALRVLTFPHQEVSLIRSLAPGYTL